MNHRALPALLILAVLPPGARAADSWKFRPGLWELTTGQDYVLSIPSTLPPEQQAKMRAFRENLKPPQPVTVQYCMDEKDQLKSMFDPANQPPGVCSERVISESGEAREIEDDCELPLPVDQHVTIPIRSVRHILLTGEGAGTIDQAEIAMHRPRESMTQNFRWVAAECGAVKAGPQN